MDARQDNELRVRLATERWMVLVASTGREIPLDLIRAYLIFRFGLRRG